MTGRDDTRQTDPYAHALELRQKRAAWEKEREERRKAKEREQKQRELTAYLKRRGQAWRDHTGTEPPLEELQRWRREYLDEQEFMHQVEREQRIEDSIRANYPY
jgi:hypothetical protein